MISRRLLAALSTVALLGVAAPSFAQEAAPSAPPAGPEAGAPAAAPEGAGPAAEDRCGHHDHQLRDVRLLAAFRSDDGGGDEEPQRPRERPCDRGRGLCDRKLPGLPSRRPAGRAVGADFPNRPAYVFIST